MENGIQISYDKEAMTKSVLDALANNTVGQLITLTLAKRIADPKDLERHYDWAVQETVRKVFLDVLQKDEAFVKHVRALITTQLTETLVQKAIAALDSRLKSNY